MKCKAKTVHSKSALKTLIILRKSPRKPYHIAMGWIHEPRTVLVSLHDKDKQKILRILCRPLARNSKSALSASYPKSERVALPLDRVPQKIFSNKDFPQWSQFQTISDI